MGRQLYPELDLWETAAPYMETWMRNRLGLAGLMGKIGSNAPKWLDQLPEIPQLAFEALNEIKQLGKNNRDQTLLLTRLHRELSEQRRQRSYSRIGGLTLIAAIIGGFLPMLGYANQQEAVVGASVLGSLGIYWMFIKP